MTDPGDNDDRARRFEPVAPDAVVSFEFVLRYPTSHREQIAAAAERLLAGKPLTSADRGAAIRFADSDDVDAVRRFASRVGLKISEVDPQTRRVQLSGTADSVRKAFGVTLKTAVMPSTTYRDYDGTVTMPADLEGIVEAVLNLSTKPVSSR